MRRLTRSRSAGVAFPDQQPTPGCRSRPQNRLKSPLVQGGTLFSSNVATQRGMCGSLESGNWKAGAAVPSGDLTQILG